MKTPPLLLILALAALFAGSGLPSQAADAPLPSLGKAPSWHLKDLQGQEVSSDQFKGKVVVLDFWATWCPPCRREIPGYVDLQKKYASQGLVIVGVSMDSGGVAGVRKFVKTYEVGYPIVMYTDAVVDAYSRFGPMDAIPTTFLIDRNGTIRDRKLGAVASSEYEKKIVRVLNDQGPSASL